MKAQQSFRDSLQALFHFTVCQNWLVSFQAQKQNGEIPVMRDSMQNVCKCAQADQVDFGLIRLCKKTTSLCVFSHSLRAFLHFGNDPMQPVVREHVSQMHW